MSGLVSILLGPVLDVVKEWGGWILGGIAALWGARQVRQRAKAEAERDQAKAGLDAQRRMNDADAKGPRSGRDAVDRLRGGNF